MRHCRIRRAVVAPAFGSGKLAIAADSLHSDGGGMGDLAVMRISGDGSFVDSLD